MTFFGGHDIKSYNGTAQRTLVLWWRGSFTLVLYFIFDALLPYWSLILLDQYWKFLTTVFANINRFPQTTVSFVSAVVRHISESRHLLLAGSGAWDILEQWHSLNRMVRKLKSWGNSCTSRWVCSPLMRLQAGSGWAWSPACCGSQYYFKPSVGLNIILSLLWDSILLWACCGTQYHSEPFVGVNKS